MGLLLDLADCGHCTSSTIMEASPAAGNSWKIMFVFMLCLLAVEQERFDIRDQAESIPIHN